MSETKLQVVDLVLLGLNLFVELKSSQMDMVILLCTSLLCFLVSLFTILGALD